MFTDPHLHLACVTQEHERLARTIQRDNLVDRLHPWHRPLHATVASMRSTLGGGLVQIGQRVQGTATLATPSPTTT